jgi:HD-GYP domain-containing protein (c-di-GMP phosphodiesterase class II)
MIKWGKIIIIPLLCMCTLLPQFLFAQNDVATALYEEGLKKYILEDYAGAIEDFNSALKLKPDNTRIQKMLVNTLIKQGNIEYENGDFSSAEDYFLRAYKLSGEDAELKENLERIRVRIAAREKEVSDRAIIRGEEEGFVTSPESVTITEAAAKDEGLASTEGPAGNEVQLPFDMEAFIQQQNTENKKLLEEMLAAQRLERESLYRSIEDSRKLLGESFEAQNEERKTLVQNIEENRKLLDRSFESQNSERRNFLQNIEESRKIFDLNLTAQREERQNLFRRIEENQRILDESMRAQQEEREFFLKNMMEISRSQKEDRKLFSRTLIILVGGSIFIAIIVFFGFVILLRRRTAPGEMIYHEPRPALDFKPDTLLEYTEKIDDSKYITDERYTDMVKAKQLRDLYSELQKGNVSWDVVQGYVSELNHEIKAEILNIVEKKIKSGETAGRESAMEILLPFITDGDRDIGAKSKSLLRGIAGETLGELPHPEGAAGKEDLGDLSDPLSTASLLQFARMADAKTGRTNHSVRVAEISYKIALKLEDPQLEPDTIRRVGLVHDIGYLELDDKIVKKEGSSPKRSSQ